MMRHSKTFLCVSFVIHSTLFSMNVPQKPFYTLASGDHSLDVEEAHFAVSPVLKAAMINGLKESSTRTISLCDPELSQKSLQHFASLLRVLHDNDRKSKHVTFAAVLDFIKNTEDMGESLFDLITHSHRLCLALAHKALALYAMNEVDLNDYASLKALCALSDDEKDVLLQKYVPCNATLMKSLMIVATLKEEKMRNAYAENYARFIEHTMPALIARHSCLKRYFNSPLLSSVSTAVRDQLCFGCNSGEMLQKKVGFSVSFHEPIQALKKYDDHRIVIGLDNGTFRLFNITNEYEGKPYSVASREQLQNSCPAKVFALAVRGSRIAAGCSSGLVYVVDEVTGVEKRMQAEMIGNVYALDWLTKDSVAIGSADGGVQVWNMKKEEPEQALYKHGDGVFAVVCTEDGRIFSGARDCMIHVWERDRTCREFASMRMPVISLNIHKGRLLAADESGIIRCYDMSNGAIHHESFSLRSPLHSCVPSGDQYCIVGNHVGHVSVMNYITGQELYYGHKNEGTVCALESLNDYSFVSACSNGFLSRHFSYERHSLNGLIDLIEQEKQRSIDPYRVPEQREEHPLTDEQLNELLELSCDDGEKNTLQHS